MWRRAPWLWNALPYLFLFLILYSSGDVVFPFLYLVGSALFCFCVCRYLIRFDLMIRLISQIHKLPRQSLNVGRSQHIHDPLYFFNFGVCNKQTNKKKQTKIHRTPLALHQPKAPTPLDRPSVPMVAAAGVVDTSTSRSDGRALLVGWGWLGLVDGMGFCFVFLGWLVGWSGVGGMLFGVFWDWCVRGGVGVGSSGFLDGFQPVAARM